MGGYSMLVEERTIKTLFTIELNVGFSDPLRPLDSAMQV